MNSTQACAKDLAEQIHDYRNQEGWSEQGEVMWVNAVIHNMTTLLREEGHSHQAISRAMDSFIDWLEQYLDEPPSPA